MRTDAGGRPAATESSDPENPCAVYFPACVNTIFGPDRADERGVIDAFIALCDRAGVPIRIPADLAGSCCGTPWHSKGLESGHRLMAARMVGRLRRWTAGGTLPVVMDATSCTHGLAELSDSLDDADRAFLSRLRNIDSVAFAREELLPRLRIERRLDHVVLHPTCSMVHLDLVSALRELAASFADTVDIPAEWRCCGFAGDRGLLHPELTASATAPQAREITAVVHDGYFSANRTCELALTRATGRPYRSILVALEQASRPEAR